MTKGFQCQECGKRMSLKAAERAASVGCTRCGGVDVDIIVPGSPHLAAQLAAEERGTGRRLRAAARAGAL